MGEVIAFDTYAYVKKLRDAGVDERQAAIQAETLASALAERLATKEELAKTEAAIRADLAKNDAAIRADLAKTEAALKLDMAAIRADIAKTDAKIETTKAELQRDIKEVEAKIEASKADTLKWTAGMFAAQTALILGAVFAMLKMNQPPPQPVAYHTPPAQEMRLPAPEMRLPAPVPEPHQQAPTQPGAK